MSPSSVTVFLLVFGMLIGTHVLNIAREDVPIELLSDLGMGFLFLLAGYDIELKKMTNITSRHGLATWCVSFAIAVGISLLIARPEGHWLSWLAIAITLTTTAFGTIVPILKERGLTGGALGDAVTAYGVWGELCPVIAIALMLTTRDTVITASLLIAFVVIAVICAIIPRRMWDKGRKLTSFITDNADTSSQMSIRAVMVLLVGLVTLSAVFDLDLVLGAFVAGFVLRFVIPAGDENLERKLNAFGYGFFIPLFFIVSGMAIDPAAILSEPLLLIVFILALLLIRALPIFISVRLGRDTKSLGVSGALSVSLYCTTALPLIVAVANISVGAGYMHQDIASLLVAAGGITVLVMPLLAHIAQKAIAAYECRTTGCPIH